MTNGGKFVTRFASQQQQPKAKENRILHFFKNFTVKI